MATIATLHFAAGDLVLSEDEGVYGTWAASDPGNSELVALATRATELSRPPHYTYSPAHGHPGYRAARQVAAALKATSVDYAPVPEPDPNLIY